MRIWTFPLIAIASLFATALPAHDTRFPHDHPVKRARELTVAQGESATAAKAVIPGVTGQAPLRFKLFKGRDILPAEAQAVLVNAHGGFAVDRREGKGEIYFALPGAGILKIASDLKSVQLLETPPEIKNANMHNAQIWYAPGGEAFLAFPGNDVAKIFTTTLEGKLVSTLDAPTPEFNFDEPKVNDYFSQKGKFVPTDIEELDGIYYITTGYSALDYVLTAKIESTNPFVVKWNDLAFGGKGSGPGQFGTGHGITVPPGLKRLDVSDRPNSEIDRFTRFGHYRSTVPLPKGSLPCDVDYEGDVAVVGCLDGPDKKIGAPIYLLKNEQVVSTLIPREDLGLDKFTHVHNATVKTMNGKIYVIAQAWNPGDFAIFEQVGE